MQLDRAVKCNDRQLTLIGLDGLKDAADAVAPALTNAKPVPSSLRRARSALIFANWSRIFSNVAASERLGNIAAADADAALCSPVREQVEKAPSAESK